MERDGGRWREMEGDGRRWREMEEERRKRKGDGERWREGATLHRVHWRGHVGQALRSVEMVVLVAHREVEEIFGGEPVSVELNAWGGEERGGRGARGGREKEVGQGRRAGKGGQAIPLTTSVELEGRGKKGGGEREGQHTFNHLRRVGGGRRREEGRGRRGRAKGGGRVGVGPRHTFNHLRRVMPQLQVPIESIHKHRQIPIFRNFHHIPRTVVPGHVVRVRGPPNSEIFHPVPLDVRVEEISVALARVVHVTLVFEAFGAFGFGSVVRLELEDRGV
jgi:hypothetical protein